MSNILNKPVPMPPLEIRMRCRAILIEVAAQFCVAPCLIVAHVVEPGCANVARKEVQARMLTEVGMSRIEIARAFLRNRRRVRRAVIGV